jgi:hypothetical protein
MVNPIPINIVIEDDLSEAVVRRILNDFSIFAIGYSYGKGGFGYIKQKLQAFNNAARGTPFIILVDLEAECPPKQIREWLTMPIHPNLVFRVAVNEVESWLLADRRGFASFLGINQETIPKNTDEIDYPKRYLIDLVRRSRKRGLREAIIPSPNSTARVGPDYNGQLSFFVLNIWNIREAMLHSDSLQRAVNAINNFKPTWERSFYTL